MFAVKRLPLRLGMAAAIFEKSGYTCEIQDYPSEEKTWQDFERDLARFDPDLLFISTTFGTRHEDLEACRIAKRHNENIVTLMKGAPGDDDGALESCRQLDFFTTREVDWEIKSIALRERLDEIPGLTYRNNGQIISNPKGPFLKDLDSLPVPAYHLYNHELYRRPDTGEKLIIITAAKGCPEECIFCTAPLGTGKALRQRSPKSIIDEVQECTEKYGVKNFLLASETFTYNKKWALEICNEILDRNLKISWNCNTRADRIDEELVEWMKRAGCHAIAMGLESGNQDTLDRMKKGITLAQAEQAVKIISAAKIRTYLTYVIGFPWETRELIEETVQFAIKLSGDITEFILAIPLYGTELHDIAKQEGILEETGRFLNDNRVKHSYLSHDELAQIYRQAMRRFYLRPSYILQTLTRAPSFKALCRTAVFGSFQLIRSLTRKGHLP
ncbi:MAG: B12-binding domain-containing radical SAM protein [Nitrospinales bacterium]